MRDLIEIIINNISLFVHCAHFYQLIKLLIERFSHYPIRPVL